MARKPLATCWSGLVAILVAAGWMAVALPVPAAPPERPSRPASPPPADGVEDRLRTAVDDLLAVPEPERDEVALNHSSFVLENAPEALARLESTTDPAARRELLRLMAITGSPVFLPALHGALAEESGSTGLALRAVVVAGDPASAPWIAPYLGDPAPGRVALALRYYAGHPRALPSGAVPVLRRHPSPAVRAALLPLLGLRHDPEALADCGSAMVEADAAVRAAAVDCLGALGGPAASERLREAFDGAHTQMRARIVAAVLRAEPTESFPHLVRWLDEPQPAVAVAALLALQVQGNPRRVPELIARIEQGTTSLPAHVLIKALGLTDDDRAVPFLGERLRQAEARAPGRTAATGEGHPPDLRPVLIEALGALGRLGGQPYLAPYLSSYDPNLREAATDALRRIAATGR